MVMAALFLSFLPACEGEPVHDLVVIGKEHYPAMAKANQGWGDKRAWYIPDRYVVFARGRVKGQLFDLTYSVTKEEYAAAKVGIPWNPGLSWAGPSNGGPHGGGYSAPVKE